MDREVLEYFKNYLLDQKRQLLLEAERTLQGMSELKEKFPDPTDRALFESDRNFILRLRDRERKLLQKIEKALKKIEEGTFGICELCGNEISEERLRVRPVTELCIDCKEAQEMEEKRRK